RRGARGTKSDDRFSFIGVPRASVVAERTSQKGEPLTRFNPYPKDTARWSGVTERLLSQFPLPMNSIVEVVLTSWEDIFHSRFGLKAYQIGRDIWPEPQVMGFLLHELVPLNLKGSYSGKWRRGSADNECD